MEGAAQQHFPDSHRAAGMGKPVARKGGDSLHLGYCQNPDIEQVGTFPRISGAEKERRLEGRKSTVSEALNGSIAALCRGSGDPVNAHRRRQELRI